MPVAHACMHELSRVDARAAEAGARSRQELHTIVSSPSHPLALTSRARRSPNAAKRMQKPDSSPPLIPRSPMSHEPERDLLLHSERHPAPCPLFLIRSGRGGAPRDEGHSRRRRRRGGAAACDVAGGGGAAWRAVGGYRVGMRPRCTGAPPASGAERSVGALRAGWYERVYDGV
jgi:hypothetical protein